MRSEEQEDTSETVAPGATSTRRPNSVSKRQEQKNTSIRRKLSVVKFVVYIIVFGYMYYKKHYMEEKSITQDDSVKVQNSHVDRTANENNNLDQGIATDKNYDITDTEYNAKFDEL
eukprot:CAMPEP_0113317468 /NCGR_PEP_ID=MMETSP0010_2-20120614/12363_1 /TAXON_ID=216773 ORGANISM="Corethron hystrix, Strain 308" /NCGR_SAMPLE_ID=MMETSP0010_2 /ASSEMBLY_ACC=CAM_ASM_000155 /LENGTH=115 /DNA_ID=CAMNT_0000174453 /DNA_START=167 /DNA_END=517 /DNA_ORIENTATION=+ /assembly_acc=CAM_ASM_000155